MEPATTTRFALAARVLAQAARGLGLRAPSFRSPPRLVGADRTLLTRAGRPTVAVRVRGRAWVPVLSDMVEGVVAANGLVGPPADRARDALWRAVAPELAAEARAGPRAAEGGVTAPLSAPPAGSSTWSIAAGPGRPHWRDAGRSAHRPGAPVSARRQWPGRPFPLGATYDGAGTNFAIFSEVAEAVELCLFDDHTEERVLLAERTALCFHAYLPDVRPGPALRLPGPRAVGSGPRRARQPRQAPARPVRQGHRRDDAVASVALLPPGRRPDEGARRPTTRRTRPARSSPTRSSTGPVTGRPASP